MIKPDKLEKGDKVGIVSPSFHINTGKNPKRVDKIVKFLEEENLEIEFGKNARERYAYLSGTVEERVNDIHRFFKKDDIKAIICSIGGYNANSLLPHLNYDLIRNNPKIFLGYKDINTINTAINEKSSLVTFNGTLIDNLEKENRADYTKEYFRKSLFSEKPIGEIKEFKDPGKYEIKEFVQKGNDSEIENREKIDKYRCIRKGECEGVIKGGNLISMMYLGGTKYMPEFKDSIMVLGEPEGNIMALEKKMEYLDQLGILEKINGMVFGRPSKIYLEHNERKLKDVLKTYGDRRNFPILSGPLIGSHSPSITLPIGVKAKMNSNKKYFSITESGVK